MTAALTVTSLAATIDSGVQQNPTAAVPSRHRGALFGLAIGTFAVGTEGFMIAALLPAIAHSFSVSIAAAGQLVTIFALVYALSSPISTALTATLPRRKLLILSLAGFCVANLVAAVAPGFWSLVAARILLALAAGLYVPNANALAGALAAPQHRGRALGIVNGGITVAIAIGVPLCAFMGAHFGWRSTFAGVAVLSAAALAALAFLLPRDVAMPAPARLRHRFAVIGAKAVFPTLLTTTLWAVGAYTVYTYVAPYLSESAGLMPSQIGLVLMVYGVAALVGVMLGGAGVDRLGSRAVQAISLPAMAIAFAGLTIIGFLPNPHAIFAIVPLIIVWGISAWSFFPAQQNRLMAIAGLRNIPVVLSLNASFMYLGFAAGAALGSIVIAFLNVAWIGAAGDVTLVAAIAMSGFAWTRGSTATDSAAPTASDVSPKLPSDVAMLFSPFAIGEILLSHRVVHAPTTRLRANPDQSPSAMMVEYYSQRASRGGLIITESVHPSHESRGYEGAPGIYTDAHVEGWKHLIEAVHAKGGVIFMQIAHDGRQSHTDLSNGAAPVAPSVVPFEGQALTSNGWVPVSPHRALEADEIPMLVELFRKAAQRAKEAGFDGIEMHNANGYLADTFLQDGTNRRTDRYGGSLENRTRFSLELVEALVSVWDADKVGVRISPSGQWGGISDSDPEATFGYFANALNNYPLAYLHIIEPRVKGVETIDEHQAPVAASTLRKIYKGVLIAAGGFDRSGAEAILQRGDADLVAFGRFFTSNPDLPERLLRNLPLTRYERAAFWGGDEGHYIDFPPHPDTRQQ
jgi:N-ethylmaleimide reductase